jgi:hypothetical protein
MFDLPASQVTEQRLQALYERKLDELQGTAVIEEPPPRQPARAAMTCR